MSYIDPALRPAASTNCPLAYPCPPAPCPPCPIPSPCCCACPGPTGPTGPTGATGLAGPTGATGASEISGAMSALNISASTISVTTDGTNISLSVQPYMDGFTVDTTNTEFTVVQTGIYLISYDIKMTSGLPMSSRLTLNGTPIMNSITTSSISSNEYGVTFMQPFTAGDILTVQLYGINGSVTLQAGTGASLNIVKIA